ncbi:MAG TPA: sigma-70 family RNA polymerase sigma factor [Terriglobales bacterium]|nr:sigma-70 family RNA polymerase sigma factor [Terriglobales bacterium]
MPSSSYPVTDLLARWSSGDASARDALVPLVYQELRRVARKCLVGQRSDHTLQPTALVHEAYLRLCRADSMEWQNRVHFFAVASQVMRQILVDHARARTAAKRGGGVLKITFSDDLALRRKPELDVLALDEALKRLSELDARQGQIVELRFFGGLSVEETSQTLDISPATTKREWATAKVWLYRAMKRGAEI